MAVNDVQYRYVSLDSDHDISGTTLTIGLDGTTYPVTATSVAAPPHAVSLKAPTAGLTRYWWRVLIGPGQTLVPTASTRALHGLLEDSPETLHPKWTFYP